jgi:hypothetical protein
MSRSLTGVLEWRFARQGLSYMGNRREPRKLVAVAVRVFGTDRLGKVFSEYATTIDVSQNGARIGGLRAKLAVDEIVGVTCGATKAHFKVKWVGAPGTPAEGTAGLLNLNPQTPLWDVLLPGGEIDTFLAQRSTDRRRWSRVKCSVSIELRSPGKPVIWGKASDLGQGGCFVEMPIPLPLGTTFEIAMWLGETKLPLQGQVASVAPGFGNGVKFLHLAPGIQEHLARFIQSITPKERAPLSFVKHSGV